MSRPFYTVLLLAAAPLAWAQSACEQAFISHGDPRNGATYMTKVRLPGLEPAMAVDQLRLSAGQQGLEVGGQRVDGNQHQQFLLYNVQGKESLPLLAVAEPDGSVGMLLSLPRNRQIEPASIRSLMCATLGGLETGAKGREQAQAAVLAHPKPVLISTTARDLAMQMEERVAAAKEEYTRVVPLQGRRHAALAKEPADNAIAPINARLAGQRYLVDGQVRVMQSGMFGGDVTLYWAYLRKKGLLGLGRQNDVEVSRNFGVACQMTAADAAAFGHRAPGDWAKLEGEFDRVEQRSVFLRNCRPAP